MMKKYVLTGLVLILFAVAAVAQHANGKTYYDADNTQPKEVYSYKEAKAEPGKAQIKHGPYFFYYESGKLKISGGYKDDQKHGEWKYYDENGKLIKSEQYENGKMKS